jgi:DNA-binding transcriptional MerR regulator
MTVMKPEVSPLGRYDTNRTCTLLGISRTTLARYRRSGLIVPRYHKANSRPYYRGEDITKLWMMTS